jgi:trimeric autotransporter adhesin
MGWSGNLDSFKANISKMSLFRPKSLTVSGRGCSGLAWVLLCAALLAGALVPRPAAAGTVVSLFKSFAGNINFVTTGGTFRTRANGAAGDACLITTTSSGPLSGIPAGSTIVAAYLYYAGSGNTADANVTFTGTNITADRTFTDTTVEPFYGGFKDLTSTGLVTGNGTYTLTNLAISNGNPWCGDETVLGGWALVVIYSNSTTETNRVINVYDGFEAFQNTNITLNPANFQVPATNINGKFAVITWEGDPSLSGNETLEYNSNVLTDNCNGTNNQYNSTINTLTCTGNATTDDVYFGVDIDTFSITPYLVAGATSGTTFYSSGQDAVVLAAQIVSISNTPVSDLGISKVHNGTFGYGDQGTYTLTVTNNGPATSTGTTTVSDTLPTGETYASATGTGWTCGAVGQVVTCTSTAAVTSGSNFNAITLTVNVATSAGTSLSNTATVSSNGNFDNTSGNNSSTDTVSTAGGSLVHPDLSTSTKDVFNPGGGDYNVGDTVQYTITLNETAGVDASSVSVADTLSTSLTGLTGVTVTGSSTTISNTSTSTALAVSNITVPANGSVTIVFTAQVKAGTANCATINNSATITYAGGSPTTQTPAAPTITVAQSSCSASGNKILYVYDNLSLTRVVQAANTTTPVTINGNGGSATWTMTPVVPTGKSLVLTAGNITASLIVANFNSSTGSTRTVTVELRKNSGTIATSGGIAITSATAAVHNFTITVPATTIAAGDQLIMVVHVASSATNRQLQVYQKTAALGNSKITFATSTVVNVDSVTAYNAVYPATTQTTVYSPGTQVFICAVISDPFGSADATSATITLVDANGVTQVSAAAMTLQGGGGKDCSGATNAAVNAFEYAYTIPAPGTAANGFWTATVTGNEGTEGTVTHTANGSYEVNIPSLTIMKTVLISTDPIEGATRAKAIPGATAQYTITVINNGRGTVDGTSLVISDPVPTNTVMSLPAKPPFTFTDGSTASGLSVGANDTSIVYSNNGGSTFVYTPACTRPCTDSAITNFKITLNGTMNGKTGASAPSFTISFNVVIQ